MRLRIIIKGQKKQKKMNTHDYFEPILRAGLKPLYKELTEIIEPSDDLCCFAMQWGEEFPMEEQQGILFVGRAVNGWYPYDNIDAMFGNSDMAIFDREDQMKWVERNENPYYNTNTSAFWRVIRRVSSTYYPNHELNHIAWSNVSKIAPRCGGNPSDKMYYDQLECSNKILATEIKLLSPKAVVFLTGEGWAKDAIEYLGHGVYPEAVAEKEWGGGFTAKLYRLDKLGIILTEHPQTKEETTHVEAIKALIDLI